MNNFEGAETSPRTFWNKAIVWDKHTSHKKFFPYSGPKSTALLFFGVPALAVIIAGYITGLLFSLSPIKIYSSDPNPLNLATVLTTTTVVAGIFLYSETSEAEKRYSRKNREILSLGSFFVLFLVFDLSAAYTIIPAINQSRCTDDTFSILNCILTSEFWLYLTLSSTLVHLIVLTILLFGCILLQQLRIPTGVARKDRILSNARAISDSVAKIDMQRPSGVLPTDIDFALWNAANPLYKKGKLFTQITIHCTLNVAILSLLKFLLLYVSTKLGFFPSIEPKSPWFYFLAYATTSSFFLTTGFYFFYGWRIEVSKRGFSIPAGINGIWLIGLAVLLDIAAASKLLEIWPLVISTVLTIGYIKVWNASLKLTLHKRLPASGVSELSRKDRSSQKLESVQHLMTSDTNNGFYKFKTSIENFSQLDSQFSMSEIKCYFGPDPSSSSSRPKSFSEQAIQLTGIPKVISTVQSIDSYNTAVSLIQLIETGLMLRSSQSEYDQASPGEYVPFRFTIAPLDIYWSRNTQDAEFSRKILPISNSSKMR